MRNPVILQYKFYLLILFLVTYVGLRELDLISPAIGLVGIVLVLGFLIIDPYSGPVTQYVFAGKTLEALTQKLNELGYRLSDEDHDRYLFVKEPDQFWKKKVIVVNRLGHKLEVKVSSRTRERRELDRFAGENRGVLV